MLESELGKDKDPNPAPVQGRKRQVLVVDDNKAVQDVLSRMIALLGYDVTVAGNGLEGGTLFVTGSYDLVVTDVQMPLMNGWELSRIVKERSPKTPVIIVTGLPEGNHGENPEKTRVDAVIPKPFRAEEFERTVQRLMK